MSVSPFVRKPFSPADAHVPAPRSTPDLLRRCFSDRREDDWFELCARIDRGVFEMIRRHRRRWPNSKLDDAEIEDLQQELFFRLLRRSEPFAGTSERQVWAYLEVCVRRLFLDLRRFHERTKRQALRQEADLDHAMTVFEPSASSALGETNPERICLFNERLRIFVDHCREVGRRADLPFLLEEAYLGGLTSAELSRRWSVSTTGIETLVAGLRRRLSAEGLTLPARPRARTQPTRLRQRKPRRRVEEQLFFRGTIESIGCGPQPEQSDGWRSQAPLSRAEPAQRREKPDHC